MKCILLSQNFVHQSYIAILVTSRELLTFDLREEIKVLTEIVHSNWTHGSDENAVSQETSTETQFKSWNL